MTKCMSLNYSLLCPPVAWLISHPLKGVTPLKGLRGFNQAATSRGVIIARTDVTHTLLLTSTLENTKCVTRLHAWGDVR